MTGLRGKDPDRDGPEHPGPDEADKLISAVADGDQAAFELIFSQLSGPVYGMALAVIRDKAQAEEITQDVFTEIWRTAARYDPGRGSLTGWALMITRRRAIDRVRAVSSDSRRERQHTVADRPWDQVSEMSEATAEREQLGRSLGTLTEHQRELIYLAFYCGYSHADIAAKLDIPLGTVKSRLRAALARLREQLRADP